MTIKANHIERYYDTHEVEGAELTQSVEHFLAIQYLIVVLQWLFHGQRVGIISSVNFYRTGKPGEIPISPDIAVADGLERRPDGTASYFVGEESPPPRVAFEIASKETWRQDLEEKPAKYNALGVNEYFVFDPNEQPNWTKQWRRHNRLIGWRRNPASGQYELLVKDEAGRLWSEELASWLVVEGEGLRLYNAEGQLRLTEAEAQEQRAEAEFQRAEAEKRKAEAERQRAEVEQRRAAAQEQRAEVEQRRAEAERQRAAAQEQRAEKLAEMLKKLGHNPEDLG
jgi:Uma2 family endonuclease